MKPILKSFLAVIGTIAAVGLLMLAAPRAAHAVVAALVQVTNTASSPVISQGIGNQAAQIVEIECFHAIGTPIPDSCNSVLANGIVASPAPNMFTVPYGQTLVVTAVDIETGIGGGLPCTSPVEANVHTMVLDGILNSPVFRKSWVVPAGPGTSHYVYPSGILFGAGTRIDSVLNSTNSCNLLLDMHGYLTAQ